MNLLGMEDGRQEKNGRDLPFELNYKEKSDAKVFLYNN